MKSVSWFAGAAPRLVSRPRRGAALSAAWVLAAVAIPGGALASSPPRPAGSAAAAPVPAAKPVSTSRWTAATPDEMVDRVLERARRGGEDALAGLVVASSLDERASFGKVRSGLAAIAASSSPLADDALARPPARALAQGSIWPGSRAVTYDAPADATGLVKSWAILGPFQDNGAGLMRREGPEAPGESWSNTRSRFAWGVYDVAWRRTLPRPPPRAACRSISTFTRAPRAARTSPAASPCPPHTGRSSSMSPPPAPCA